jgi:FkbM family methyltransferase
VPRSAPLVRRIARRAAALLPASARRRVADYRFGYSTGRRRFDLRVENTASPPLAVIDNRVRISSTSAFLTDLRFHFVENGESRDEMGAFLDTVQSLAPDALLFDVGAHRGIFSLLHCASGDGRRAVLFEPSISLSSDARVLISMNGFAERAEVRACGLGDRTESRLMNEDALGFAQPSRPDAGGTTIPFTTLDEEWRRTRDVPAIVKIDVEGFEGAVVRGGAALFRDVRPIVFLELHLDTLERRGEPVDSVLGPLTSAGYRFTGTDGRPRSARAIKDSLRAIIRVVGRP